MKTIIPMVCLLVLTGCSSKVWTKDQVLAAYDGPLRYQDWCPKEIASNQFLMITSTGKYLKP